MIVKSHSCWKEGFVRIARGNTIKVTAVTNNCSTQRDWFRTLTTSLGHKTASTKTVRAVAGISLGRFHPSSSSSSSSSSFSISQQRFRSALPDHYSESDYSLTDDSLTASSTGNAAYAAGATASTPFFLADIGEGIAEVELLRWFVTEGQMIREFDPVCEVQSDKATVEITSRYEGRVDKLAFQASGSMIRVGEPILWIREKNDGTNDDQQDEKLEQGNQQPMATSTEGNAIASGQVASVVEPMTQSSSSRLGTLGEQQEQGQEQGQEQEHQHEHEQHQHQHEHEPDTGASRFAPVATSSKVLTSPAVRKLARDHSLDLSALTGTGPSGRITKGDILEILKESPSSHSVISSAEEGDSSSNERSSPSIGSTSELGQPLKEDVVVPLRGYNRIMADTMTASLKIPHMVYSDEINLNRFVRYKMEQKQTEQKKLIFLPLAIKAASKALEKYPWLNSSFDDEKQEATLWKDHNIGIAMDTPRGLIVPVLKHCQDKTLPEIAEELKRLKDSVTCQEGPGGGLPASDLQGTTFTLSNVGAIGGGGTYMSPIVTPPQVAIGALGQIQRLPRFVTNTSNEIEEAHICTVSWAADHRVVDGATVARFHQSWKEYMEDPIRLLMELR